MQVSWIDANDLQSLLARVVPQGEPVTKSAPPPEIAPDLSAAVMSFVSEMPVVDAPAPKTGTEERLASQVSEPVLGETNFDSAESPASASAGELEPPHQEDHGKGVHNEAAALPLGRIRERLRAIRQRAAEAGILTHAAEVPPIAMQELPVMISTKETMRPVTSTATPALAFDVPHGSQGERLAAFSAWARQALHEGGGHVLVISEDGEVLWGGEAKAGLVLSTMMAWGAAIRANAMPSEGLPRLIHQPLSSGHVLTVIPCETAAGIMHAAVVAPEGLTDELAAVLRGALCAALATA